MKHPQVEPNIASANLAEVAATLARVIPALHEHEFPQIFTQALMDLTGAEDGTLLWFRSDHLPQVAYNEPRTDGAESSLDAYLQGAFLLDPFYRAAGLDGLRGIFSLGELAPEGFRDSEYFSTWYPLTGFNDECGVLLSLPDGFLHCALTNMTPDRFFTAEQLRSIADAYPAIEALAQSHWANAPQFNPKQPQIRQQLNGALATFGSSLLTRREREVVEYVLLGNSTRRIAEKLGVSAETIKLHRKHAYSKLDISSQGELFHLFMDCIFSIPHGYNKDPLIAYQQR
jgi:DNA-binding CsgD family transcriptional regulator